MTYEEMKNHLKEWQSQSGVSSDDALEILLSVIYRNGLYDEVEYIMDDYSENPNCSG